MDGTATFCCPDLHIYQPYSEYAITATLCWVKNCKEERNDPTQIIFWAADWRYCVLSLLSVCRDRSQQCRYPQAPQVRHYLLCVSGCSREDINIRARWQSNKKQQDNYVNMTISYVNGNMVFSLRSAVTVRNYVVPRMAVSGVSVLVCAILFRHVEGIQEVGRQQGGPALCPVQVDGTGHGKVPQPQRSLWL